MKSDIYKAGGILIKDRKLLVERSQGKDIFLTPGGRIEEGETAREALVRELFEEFRIKVLDSDLEEFGTFTSRSATSGDKILTMYVFFVKSWEGEPTPDNEIEEILWIDSSFLGKIKIGSIFEHEVIPRLKDKNLID